MAGLFRGKGRGCLRAQSAPMLFGRKRQSRRCREAFCAAGFAWLAGGIRCLWGGGSGLAFHVQVLLIGLINFAAAFVQASCGFGYAMAAMALMPLILPMLDCSSISAVTVVVIAAQMSLSLRKHLSLRTVWLPVVSSMLTIPLGIWFLMTFPETLLRGILAALLLVLTLFFFRTRRRRTAVRGVWYNGAAAGLITGVSTGMFNIVGPFFMVYYISVCEELLTYKACMEFSFLIAGLYSTALHAVNGNLRAELLPCYIASALGAYIAGRLGLKVFRRIDREKLSVIVYILLPLLALTLLLGGR